MITQQELDIIVAQLNKAPMDQAQMYAVSAIIRKLQDGIKAQAQQAEQAVQEADNGE